MVDVSAIARHVVLGSDGIWRAPTHEDVSYPSDGNQACFQVEDSSFWFKHRNACIAAAVKGFPPPNREPIFDIGGGNGFVSLGLANAGFETVLVEPGELGALNGKKRGIATVICATTTTAGFRSSTLGAVGLFDVIEHAEDDLAFLRSIRDLLKAGGRLYATVPAYSPLWSSEDHHAGHFRRYTCKSIGAVVEHAGLTLEYLTYIFRPLPLPIFLLRALPHRLGLSAAPDDAKDLAKVHSPSTGRAQALMDRLLRGELKNIDSKRAMSFGGSCLVVARAA